MTKHEEILSHLPAQLDSPITIKSSPHNVIAIIYEIDGREDKGIWLRIGDGTWHQLEEKDKHYDMISNSILQRLKLKK